MFSDDEMIPISTLSHYYFCPRRVALIHNENLWQENQWTSEGRVLHENVDRFSKKSSRDLLIVRSLRLFDRLRGVYGIADVVEFHRQKDEKNGVSLNNKSGTWLPVPIEYKRGKIRTDESYCLQLCAQAFCLEFTYNTILEYGFLYFCSSGARKQIFLTSDLRNKTEETIIKVRSLLSHEKTPLPIYNKRCKQCSMNEMCMPKITDKVSCYLKKNIFTKEETKE